MAKLPASDQAIDEGKKPDAAVQRVITELDASETAEAKALTLLPELMLAPLRRAMTADRLHVEVTLKLDAMKIDTSSALGACGVKLTKRSRTISTSSFTSAPPSSPSTAHSAPTTPGPSARSISNTSLSTLANEAPMEMDD